MIVGNVWTAGCSPVTESAVKDTTFRPASAPAVDSLVRSWEQLMQPPETDNPDDLDRYWSCERKIRYWSIKTATRAAYHLSEVRGCEYDPYVCRWCQGTAYHIGRRPKDGWILLDKFLSLFV